MLPSLCLVVLGQPPVYAAILAPLRIAASQTLAQVTTIEFTPEPSPTPAPTETPLGPPQTIHGGPITFSLNGSLQFGAQTQTSTFGNVVLVSPSPSASPVNVLQSLNQTQGQTTESIGLAAQIDRRTATTVADLRFPFGIGPSGSILGTVNAFYSTPLYSVVYSAQPLLLFGQLPIGSTLRGLAFVLPLSTGDLTMFEGPTLGAQGETLRLYGERLRIAEGSNFYELGLYGASGPFTGNSRTLIFGAAKEWRTLSLIGEGAFQTRSGADGDPGGPAFQLRLDDGTLSSDFEATIRHLPDYFVAYGAGEVFGDNYFDANYRMGGGVSQFAVDANWERIGTSVGETTATRTESLLYSGGLGRFGGFGLGLQELATSGSGNNTLTNQATFQSSIEADGVGLLFGSQYARSIEEGAGVVSTTGYNVGLSKLFGQYGVQLSTVTQRSTETNSAPTSSVATTFAISRNFGRTGIGFSETLTHTISSMTDSLQRTPLLTVSRQISPAVNAQTTFGIQTLTDRLNPASNGHSRIFTLQLSAPFSFGNGLTTGRIDPKLPATIVGRVESAPSNNGRSGGFGGFASSAGGGGGALSNVAITLDGRYLQRTDLTGGFQFSFITPGQHQLRIDTSSLPRGLTVDQPVLTITVQGGQVAQVLFQVGNFGGILGHIYGLDTSGSQTPLQNVSVRLDGGPYSQTDATGAFGFGGLQQGQHTVEVIENTVPAFATFSDTALKQTVTVQNGQYTPVTFSAVPLGSISGTVLYGPEMLPDKGAVPNVYVVAEPGEYAGIDNEDGTYVIDNVPPGTYTVSVDPETMPESLGAKPSSVDVTLAPGGHVDNVNFTAGRFEKKVVFSFVGGAPGATAAVRVRENRLPPLGATEVAIQAPASMPSVSVTAFEKRIELKYDKDRKEWVGEIEVPADAKPGNYDVAGEVSSGSPPPSATITVDPKMPLAILQMTPRNAVKGQYVQVRARFLVDAREGDKIEWEDGQTTVLPKPVTGRVFTFSVLLSLRPLHGVLLIRGGNLPIELL
jgi:hypothetical protein